MKTATSLLLAALLLTAGSARAEDRAGRGRGWLTGVGLGLTALSFTGFGLGLAGVLNAADANHTLAAYVGNGRAPLPEEAGTVKELQNRAGAAQSQATVGFVLGGLALAGAITCLVLDGVWATQPVSVAFAPSAGGGALLFSGRF
ncbi:MAG: hypothetical protein AMXMBFR34_18780 [Myxococcaceae bacterium]